MLMVHVSFLHVKQLLMELFFENQQTYATLLLGLMPAIYIPTRCVNLCLPVFLRVGTSDIGDLMKNFAEEERLLSQPPKMLISGITLHNGTLITPLLLFYLQLRLVCTKIHRFVEYTPKKCFNSFVQAAVDTGRKRAKIPNSIVIEDTIKPLANSFYSYQITD